MRAIITTVILTGLAVGTGHYAGRLRDHLMNKAVGLPDAGLKMPAPVPPEQQPVIDTFEPNNQFEPSPADPRKLVPVDPDRRAAAEWSEVCQAVSVLAYRAAWLIPAVGVLLALFGRLKRRPAGRNEGSPGPAAHPGDALLEAKGGGTDVAKIDRMIAEIETYLAVPPKDAESFWESEERRFLRSLLGELKGRRGAMEGGR